MIDQPNGPARFPEAEDLGHRDWGRELLLMLSRSNYMMKLITMKQGKKGGLQYHRLKDEAGIMMTGSMIIRYDPGNGELVERKVSRGDVFHFPQGCVHQAEALTNCSYIEASTTHFNDRVHVEKEYGLPSEMGGLPSTKLEDVESR